MKRAASFGRAPDDGRRRRRGRRCSATRATSTRRSSTWRADVVHGADHEYGVRRAIVDAVPDAVLRMPPQVAGAARASSARRAAARSSTARRPRRPTCDDGPRPVLARADGLAARRQRAHRAVQLALRPPPRRHVHPAHRGHRRGPHAATSGSSAIQDTLRWLGLDWDEGPVLQSDRFDAYLAAADRLLAAGHAYECYCTEDEVRERNDAAIAAGRPPGYDGHCRDLTADERAALAAEGRPAHRSGSARPTTGVSTLHRPRPGRGARSSGRRSRDFVIVRSDGIPIFFLANAVDDIDMGITHVIRGEDLIDSTHRVLALARRARCAATRPVYAHLPLILGADRGQAVEAPRRGRGRGLPRPRATSPRRCSTTSRCSAGRPPTTARGARRATSSSPRSTSTASRTRPRSSTAKKLDWLNGEWIRRLAARRARRRGCEPLARGAVRRPRSTASVAARRSRIGAGARGHARADRRPDGLPLRRRRRVRDRARRRGTVVETTDRVAEVLDAVDRARRGVRVDASTRSTCAAAIEALGMKPRKVMPRALRRGRGRRRGPAALRLDLAARARAHARAAARGPRPHRIGSAEDASR